MKIIKNTIILSVLTLSVLLSAPTEIADVLKKTNGTKVYLSPLMDDKKAKKILIKNFLIEDAYSINNDELQDLLKEYKNRELTFSQVQNLSSLITKYYRDKGFFVARAYVPVQKMTDGNLKIVVIEGAYGNLNIKNKSLYLLV